MIGNKLSPHGGRASVAEAYSMWEICIHAKAIYDAGAVIRVFPKPPVCMVNIYDTAPRLRHTSELRPLFWQNEELLRTVSFTECGRILDEIRRILVHRGNI